jgi:hypothetical protein
MATGGIERLRQRVRQPLVRTPFVWDLLMQVRSDKSATLARRGTAIVIEGFPRSGNTFSAAAFLVANGRDTHVGRHLHGARHLHRARRLHVPAVALVRSPGDAVLSYLIRRSNLTAEDAVREYVEFYRTAWAARDGFVVGLFDVVVSDFGTVIDEVNDRCGTRFARYDPTPENEAAAFALVEEMNRLESGGEVVETHVGRPSAERRDRKRELEAVLREPRTMALLRQAEALHADYVQLARSQGVAPAPTD